MRTSLSTILTSQDRELTRHLSASPVRLAVIRGILILAAGALSPTRWLLQTPRALLASLARTTRSLIPPTFLSLPQRRFCSSVLRGSQSWGVVASLTRR